MKIDHLKKLVDFKNNIVGELKEFDCAKCLNKGYILRIDKETLDIVSYECYCMLKRKNIRDIQKLGLSDLFNNYTFAKFKTDEEWQVKFKQRAYAYAKNPKGWLFIGGQIGSGKTLAGISILNELISNNYRCKFISWQELMQKLKTNVNEQEYFDILKEYSEVEVLYLDDLFKGGYNNNPTNSDIRLTQILIDKRYLNNKITIISSEMLKEEILELSESIGSRIVEKSKGNIIQIVKDKERNYRLKWEK